MRAYNLWRAEHTLDGLTFGVKRALETPSLGNLSPTGPVLDSGGNVVGTNI